MCVISDIRAASMMINGDRRPDAVMPRDFLKASGLSDFQPFLIRVSKENILKRMIYVNIDRREKLNISR